MAQGIKNHGMSVWPAQNYMDSTMPMMTGSGIASDSMSRSLAFWRAEVKNEHDETIHGPFHSYLRYRAALRVLRILKIRRETLPFIVEDPGFNVLMDLFINVFNNRRVSFGDACVAALVPQTTALRAIYSLIDQGYLSRMDDQNDNRRKLLSLTQAGMAMMCQYMDRVIGEHSG